MPAEISEGVRHFIAERAGFRCEYCLLHEDDSYSPHQIDHIVSRKHDGDSTVENLAYCCIRCNLWKGTDIAGRSRRTGAIIALFNPRKDRWADHFRLDRGVLEPLTDEAEATARLLRLNLDQRVTERRRLILAGRYSVAG